MARVVVSSYDVSSFPDGGGHFWVYLQYVEALRRAGCDVYWMEQCNPPVRHPTPGESALEIFFERARTFGLEGQLLPYFREDESRRWIGTSRSDAEDDGPDR